MAEPETVTRYIALAAAVAFAGACILIRWSAERR
jgi:hypothetical protein